MTTYAQQVAADQAHYAAIKIDRGIRQQGADALASLLSDEANPSTSVLAEQIGLAMTEGHAARVRDAQADAATTANQQRAETDRAVLAELFGEQPPAA